MVRVNIIGMTMMPNHFTKNYFCTRHSTLASYSKDLYPPSKIVSYNKHILVTPKTLEMDLMGYLIASHPVVLLVFKEELLL